MYSISILQDAVCIVGESIQLGRVGKEVTEAGVVELIGAERNWESVKIGADVNSVAGFRDDQLCIAKGAFLTNKLDRAVPVFKFGIRFIERGTLDVVIVFCDINRLAVATGSDAAWDPGLPNLLRRVVDSKLITEGAENALIPVEQPLFGTIHFSVQQSSGQISGFLPAAGRSENSAFSDRRYIILYLTPELLRPGDSLPVLL